MELVPLDKVPCGKIARVKELTTTGSARRRLLDLGLIRNTLVKSLRKSPSGDPTAYAFRGFVIALRSEEASRVLVEII